MLRSLVAPKEINGEFTLQRNLNIESLEEAWRSNHQLWIDIVDPPNDEIKWLEDLLDLHPAVVSDLYREDRRPTLLVYPQYIFLSLFQPKLQLMKVEGLEIHCLITDNLFVTVRNSDATAVDSAYDRAAKNFDSWKAGVAYMLYLTTQYVVDSYYPLLDSISNQLYKIEEEIFENGRQKSYQQTIYRTQRQLITLRQMVAPQREVLSNVIGEERLAQTSSNRELFRHLYERLLRVYDVIDSQRDLASNVLELMRNQEASRLGEAVTRLTIISMIFLPLTLLVSLFDLNFITTDPILTIPLHGVWVFGFILILTASSASFLARYFRYRGWI